MSWELTDKHTPCPISGPVAVPSLTDVCGLADNDTVNLPKNTEFYSYEAGPWSNGSIVVTATAAPGYVFPDGKATMSWTLTDKHTPCQVQPPSQDPTTTDPCGPDNATWNLPTGTSTYTWSIVDKHLIATATAGNVFVKSDGTTTPTIDYGTAPDRGTLCTITVVKSALPVTVAEPGGQVKYTITITNTSALGSVSLSTLVDDKFGDVFKIPGATCTTGVSIEAGASYSCTFTAMVSGNAGYAHTNVVAATTTGGGTGTGTATVTVTDSKPSLTVTKTASPAVVTYPGGNVTYTLTITNTSASTDPITLMTLTDTVGTQVINLFGGTVATTCKQGTVIQPGALYTCTFTLYVDFSTVGLTKSIGDTVAVGVIDDEKTPGSGSGSATVSDTWKGRTPGYWKNHTAEWPKFSVLGSKGTAVAVAPKTLVRDVFTIPTSYTCIGAKDTLAQSLNYGGGSTVCAAAQNLLRAATSAMLNEAYYGSKYPPYSSAQELITAVNAAIASGDRNQIIELQKKLDFWNNGDHTP